MVWGVTAWLSQPGWDRFAALKPQANQALCTALRLDALAAVAGIAGWALLDVHAVVEVHAVGAPRAGRTAGAVVADLAKATNTHRDEPIDLFIYTTIHAVVVKINSREKRGGLKRHVGSHQAVGSPDAPGALAGVTGRVGTAGASERGATFPAVVPARTRSGRCQRNRQCTGSRRGTCHRGIASSAGRAHRPGTSRSGRTRPPSRRWHTCIRMRRSHRLCAHWRTRPYIGA